MRPSLITLPDHLQGEVALNERESIYVVPVMRLACEIQNVGQQGFLGTVRHPERLSDIHFDEAWWHSFIQCDSQKIKHLGGYDALLVRKMWSVCSPEDVVPRCVRREGATVWRRHELSALAAD